jgi:fatty acid desaturase
MQISRLIRYPIDIVSVLIVLCTLSLQLTALARNWPWYVAIPIVLLVRQVSIVEHNHVHLPIFWGNFLNSLLGWLCQLSNGLPLESYRTHHVANHHRYNNRFDSSGRDWSSPFGFRGTRYPDRPIGRVYYMATFPFLAHGESLLWFLRAPTSRTTRAFLVSMAVVWTVSGVLVWLSPAGFMKFFLLPWIVTIFGVGDNNYDQHKGCKMTSPYDSANDALDFFHTVLSFNLGYHVEHHIQPNLHWSLLPCYHKALSMNSPDDHVHPLRTVNPMARD